MSGKSKDTAKKDAKAKSGGFFAKVGKFFREYRSELKKISWPTFAEVVKNTAITLAVVLIIGAVIWIFDWGINGVRTWLLNSLKGETTVSEDAKFEDDLQDIIDSISPSDSVSGSEIAIPGTSASDANA